MEIARQNYIRFHYSMKLDYASCNYVTLLYMRLPRDKKEIFEFDLLFFNSVVAPLDCLVESHLQLFKVNSEFADLIFDSIARGACDE